MKVKFLITDARKGSEYRLKCITEDNKYDLSWIDFQDHIEAPLQIGDVVELETDALIPYTILTLLPPVVFSREMES